MEGDKRKDRRVPSYAKALLVERHIPGYIRELSSSGCQVSFIQPVDAVVGDIISVRIIAEHDPAIAPFVVHLRIRRIIDDPPWHSLGTEIEKIRDPLEAAAFEGLVSYYAGTAT